MVDESIFKPGEAFGEAYDIDRMLTREIFAETYLATRRSKRESALITCSRFLHVEGGPPPERVFRQDVERLRKLRPRQAPALTDAGTEAGIYWIATRHVEAPTVADLNQKNADKPRVWLVGDTLSAALDVANALGGARQIGVLHGDLSPSRVLVDGLPMEHVLVVTGLGQADLFRLDVGTARSSPRYRSPEQLAGEPIDERSDIFALGMLLYGWLAGAAPFAEQEPLENDQLITLVEHGQPRPLTEMGVAPPVWDLVATMIQKDPGRRFQSWLDFIDVLSPFLEDVMVDVMVDAAARRAARRKDPDAREEPSASPSGPIKPSRVRRKRSIKPEAAGSPSSPRNSDGPRGEERHLR